MKTFTKFLFIPIVLVGCSTNRYTYNYHHKIINDNKVELIVSLQEKKGTFKESIEINDTVVNSKDAKKQLNLLILATKDKVDKLNKLDSSLK